VCLSQQQRSKSLHACYIPRSPCRKRPFLVLLLLSCQAIWACSTAALESLLPAKPLGSFGGLCPVRLCVCYSSNATKAFMHAAFPAPAAKKAFLIFCFCSFRPLGNAQHSWCNVFAGSNAPLNQSVMCMLSASVCLSQQQCSDSSHACCCFRGRAASKSFSAKFSIHATMMQHVPVSVTATTMPQSLLRALLFFILQGAMLIM